MSRECVLPNVISCGHKEIRDTMYIQVRTCRAQKKYRLSVRLTRLVLELSLKHSQLPIDFGSVERTPSTDH